MARSHGTGKITGIPRLDRAQGWGLRSLLSARASALCWGTNRFLLFIPSLCLSNHEITEEVGKDFKDEFVPTSCHGQGHFPPGQAALIPIQLGLEHLQA